MKITRNAVITGMIILFIGMFFTTFWLFGDNTKILNDYLTKNEYRGTEVTYGWIHLCLNTLMVFADIIWVILFIWELGEEDEYKRPFALLYGKDVKNKYKNTSDKEEDLPVKSIRWKRWVWTAVAVILVLQIFKFGKVVYKQSVFMYNTSKIYHNTYQQKVEEKLGFYDKLWKTYQTKAEITKMSKDVFIEVTKIIMANVADGEKLSWKWISRYPDIDYNQFTAFYADLSDYITKEREGYFSIEKACQLIANKNNTMIDTFPNNIYNHFLKVQKINFQYGFLSDSTNHVFATKIENLK